MAQLCDQAAIDGPISSGWIATFTSDPIPVRPVHSSQRGAIWSTLPSGVAVQAICGLLRQRVRNIRKQRRFDPRGTLRGSRTPCALAGEARRRQRDRARLAGHQWDPRHRLLLPRFPPQKRRSSGGSLSVSLGVFSKTNDKRDKT